MVCGAKEHWAERCWWSEMVFQMPEDVQKGNCWIQMSYRPSVSLELWLGKPGWRSVWSVETFRHLPVRRIDQSSSLSPGDRQQKFAWRNTWWWILIKQLSGWNISPGCWDSQVSNSAFPGGCSEPSDANLPRKHSLQLLLKVPNSGYFGARERVEVGPIREGNTCIQVAGVNTVVLHVKNIHQILEGDLHLQCWWCLVSRVGLSSLSLINDCWIHCAVKQFQ